uniref:tRNA-uridine aminocarboxypropyltransferase n=1 Tax=Oryza punctata TaxID=4537 RepID=A0A0E0KFR1_ORYPU
MSRGVVDAYGKPHVSASLFSSLPFLSSFVSSPLLFFNETGRPAGRAAAGGGRSGPRFLVADAGDHASWCRSTPPAARANPTLLLLDGKWKQANEMHAASLPLLSSFAVPISLPVDCGVDGDSMFEGELVVKELYKGCMSTMEAVAGALRLLEPDQRLRR